MHREPHEPRQVSGQSESHNGGQSQQPAAAHAHACKTEHRGEEEQLDEPFLLDRERGDSRNGRDCQSNRRPAAQPERGAKREPSDVGRQQEVRPSALGMTDQLGCS